MAKILDGRKVSELIIDKIKEKLTAQKYSISVISIGGDENTIKYINQKEKLARNLGVDFHLYEMLPTVAESQVIKLISELNQSSSVQGIIVQLPMPKNLNREKILKIISKEKDIDGLNPVDRSNGATALAVLKILDFYKIDYKHKIIGIVGNGYLVGQPLSQMLKKKKVDYKIWGENTPNLKQKTSLSDVLVLGTGEQNLIKADMVKEGAVVIDCGGSKPELSHDAISKISAYTPVPGGIGPVTLAILFENLVR